LANLPDGAPACLGGILVIVGALPIQSMTFEEKLRAMEELRESISSNESLLEVPDWHLDALRSTEADIRAGSEPLLDWDAAKADLVS
jgi:hypothetical protein